MSARPNPDCPSFAAWRGVGRRQQLAAEADDGGPTGFRWAPSRGLLASLPPELAPVMAKIGSNTRLGVTLRGLKRLRAQLVDFFGGEEAFAEINTNQVKDLFVAPLTRARRCRLIELPGMVDPADQGPPAYFVSHACRNKTARLFDYVLSYLQAAGEETTVWLDVFSVNQHESSTAHQRDMETFGASVAECGGGAIVVMDTACINPATRAWCIYEWAHALAVHGPDGFHLQLSPGERAAIFRTVNFDKADAGPKDKAMIERAVLEQHGSTAAFDTALKLQLLLEPLSYSVDLRRLLRRAQGTAWALGPVEAWLRQPRGSRVLCVSAGAGEGKSTVSAVLCGGGQLTAGSVAAFHFLKYSDQRRLDPVRIVKSLAFQLAARVPSLASWLLGLDVEAVARLGDPEAAFELLLLRPLAALEAQGPPAPAPLVLLLDALDEADPLSEQLGGGPEAGAGAGEVAGAGAQRYPLPVGNRALQLVARQLARLPAFVRFVLTTRPEAASGQVLPCLERTFGKGGVALVAPAQLRFAAGGAAGASGAAVAGGVMVYHTAREAAAAEPASAAALPPAPAQPTLADVYGLYGSIFGSSFGRLSGGEGGGVRDLLGLLQAAREPLAQSFLVQLGVGPAVPQLPGSPTLFFVDEHRLYSLHKSLGEWLTDPARSGAFAADTLRGDQLLGLLLARTWRNSPARAYALKYVLAHLGAAAHPGGGRQGSAEAAAALDGLLGDFDFLHSVASAGLLPQAVSTLGALPSHSTTSGDMMRWLRAEQYALSSLPSPGDMARHALASAPLATAAHALARAPADLAWHTAGVLGTSSQGNGAVHWTDQQFVLQGSRDRVQAVAFSRCGRALASVGSHDDPAVKLWDCSSGQCTATLLGHTSAVESVAFSPDGRTLASGAADETVRLWDAPSGQCVAVLRGHKGRAYGVAFSPDGRVLAGGIGFPDKQVRLWDVASGESWVLWGHSDDVNDVAFHPADSGLLASGCGDGTVKLWDMASRQCVRTFHCAGKVSCIAFSPDGGLIASSNVEATVELWDTAPAAPAPAPAGDAAPGAGAEAEAEAEATASAKPVATLKGHRGRVDGGLDFSPDGALLASGCVDQTVRVWDLASRQCVQVLRGHAGPITCVAFRPPHGRMLASGSWDKTARMWEVAAQPPGQAASAPPPPQQQPGHVGRVEALAFSPDGRTLASGSADNTVRLWDHASGACAAPLQGHTNDVTSLAFSLDGRMLASGSRDNTARLWDAASGSCLATLSGHTAQVAGVALSPAQGGSGSALLATGSGDKTVKLWDCASRQCTATLLGHTEGVRSVAFSPSPSHGGALLASGGDDATVRLWDAPSGRCVAVLRGHTGWVLHLAFAADGGPLASAGGDHTIRLWDPASGRCIHTLSDAGERSTCLAFRPDGRVIASGCDGHMVKLWDCASGLCTASLRGHTDTVRAVAFCPTDGTLLASGASDNTVRLWRDESQSDPRRALQHWARLGDAGEAGRLLAEAAGAGGAAALLGYSACQDGSTALTCAAAGGSAEAVAALLGAGADPRVATRDGHTPLHLACKAGHVGAARALLAAAPAAGLLEAATEEGCTPLWLACEAGRLEAARALLAAGASMEAASKDGRTPLLAALSCGRQEVALALLAAGARRGAVAANGSTALHCAAQGDCLQAALALLRGAAGPPVDAVNQAGGDTALTLACRAGHTEVVRALLGAGADRELANKKRHTPLHCAALAGSVEAATALIEAGARLEATLEDGSTPLHRACKSGHLEAVRLLLRAGADIEAPLARGRETPLLVASLAGRLEVVQELLAAGANVHARTEVGHNAAGLALRSEAKEEVMAALWKAGCQMPWWYKPPGEASPGSP